MSLKLSEEEVSQLLDLRDKISKATKEKEQAEAMFYGYLTDHIRSEKTIREDPPQVRAVEAPPTEKQLGFLKQLGISTFNGTRKQASDLIEQKLEERKRK